MRKLLLRPEAVIYLTLFIFVGVFAIFYFLLGQSSTGNFISYTFGRSGKGILWALIPLSFAFVFRLGVLWVRAFTRGVDPSTFFSRQSAVEFSKKAGEFFKNLLFVGVPFVLSFYALTSALGQLNIFNSTRLKDELLFQWDVFLTHTFPPLSLSAVEYPQWFIGAVDFSFSSLVAAFALFGAYLFYANQKLFREAAIAFCVGSLLAFAGWVLFPVLSPHDRFIDNVYNLSMPSEVRSYVQEYDPQEEIRVFLEGMRKSKENLSVLPTSTFPSAHVFWAGLLVYYAYRLYRWLIVLALPFAVFSSIGTFLFAQHYFVDVPAGIVVAVISVLIASAWAKKYGYIQ